MRLCPMYGCGHDHTTPPYNDLSPSPFAPIKRFYIPAAMESNPMTIGLVLGTKFWIYMTATYYVSSILLWQWAELVGRGGAERRSKMDELCAREGNTHVRYFILSI